MTNVNIATELNMDELAFASGGDGLRDHPLYNTIKKAYKEKGYTAAVYLCNYYNLSYAEMKKILELIQNEAG